MNMPKRRPIGSALFSVTELVEATGSSRTLSSIKGAEKKKIPNFARYQNLKFYFSALNFI